MVIRKFAVCDVPPYGYAKLEDVSTGVCRRYRTELGMFDEYVDDRDAIREAVIDQMRMLRGVELNLGPETSGVLTSTPKVIYTFVYPCNGERHDSNWIARAQYIDHWLPRQWRPIAWKGDDLGEDVVIDWRK